MHEVCGSPLLSVVVPCHNEEECLPLFCRAIAETARELSETYDGMRVELVLVDDGSSDGTLAVMKRISGAVRNGADGDGLIVRWISFSRNFGKEAALLAGLQHSAGELVVTMDADMQDPPTMIPDMVRILMTERDVDCVAARRTSRRGEPPVRSLFSRLFYRMLNGMSTVPIPSGARDFRMMRRIVVDAITSMPERNRFTKGLYGWVGFHTVWVDYPNVPRAAGRTNWSFWRLAMYAAEGIVSCSTVPLTIVSWIGVLLCVVAFAATCFIAVRALAYGDPVAGWPSLACIVTFIGGLQLLCLGIIGQYLAKTYIETKRRPEYVVREEGGSSAEA